MKLIKLAEVDSTNEYLKQRYDSLGDATIVFAENQTAGRGRMGRSWLSRKGNILASILMKKLKVPHYYGNWCVAISVCQLLDSLYPGARIKWPNDIYYSNHKIAGILSEAVMGDDNSFLGVVVGVGVNVNMSLDDLELIDQPATSIYQLSKAKVDLQSLYESFWQLIIKNYNLLKKDPNLIYNSWKELNFLLGKEIELEFSNGDLITGVFEDIALSGAMILNVNGELKQFMSGEVKIKKDLFLK
jgi:BirA family biotin operon repressor/biotin-[acetyl-CoA-carboxylase] ligase